MALYEQWTKFVDPFRASEFEVLDSEEQQITFGLWTSELTTMHYKSWLMERLSRYDFHASCPEQ